MKHRTTPNPAKPHDSTNPPVFKNTPPESTLAQFKLKEFHDKQPGEWKSLHTTGTFSQAPSSIVFKAKWNTQGWGQ